MFLMEWKFTPKEGLGREIEGADGRLSWFITLCTLSGQILGDVESSGNDPYTLFVHTADEDALDPKSDLYFTARERAEVEKYFDVSYRVLDADEGGCRCEKRQGVEMWTEKHTLESPFVCLSCGKRIPLYRLPTFENGSFDDTKAWQETFRAMLSLNDTVYYDAFTSEELMSHTSKLNVRGREIAKTLQDALGVPVYYRLHEIDETEKFQPRKRVDGVNLRICPACGKVMRSLAIADDENIEVCDECGYSSAEETEEIW